MELKSTQATATSQLLAWFHTGPEGPDFALAGSHEHPITSPLSLYCNNTVVQHDGPSIAKVPPYPRFYNYDPKKNRRLIIHRNPYIPREKTS